MIKIENVTKYYKTNNKVFTALDNVSFEVSKGEIFGIVGRSGAGKSTLLRCVNLLETPDSGNIIIDNQNLLDLSAKELRQVRTKIGVIFQHFNLLNNLTCYENIILPLKLQDVNKSTIKNKAHEIINITGLEPYLSKYPSQLSGGQKQRVAIARALINQPKVLLSDEATSALDPESTDIILDLLKKINQELGVTILLITHEMDVIKKICNRAAVIDKGALIEQNNVINLYTKPVQAYTKELFKLSDCDKLTSLISKQLSFTKDETHKNPLVELNFIHDYSYMEPFISVVSRELNLNINILQGNINMIQNRVVGELKIVVKTDEDDKIKAFLEKAQNSKVNAEVLGYVS